MAFFKIPLAQNYPWYEFRTVLAGVTYTFELRYNVRINRWMMAIKDTLGVPILAGVPLLIDRALTSQYPTLPLPDGVMFVMDGTGNEAQPTLSSFLTTHALYFDDGSGP